MPRRIVEMEGSGQLPGDTISIVVCTRDRPADLERCLEALLPLAEQGHEVIIVDNAPQTEAAAGLVRRYPYRYLVEAEPGLNRARNLGLRAASRPIIAFTDDDCVPDPGWAAALRSAFSDPKTGAATGLVLPLELRTDAQAAFEAYCANRRIFQKRRYSAPQTLPSRAGVAGMGANMAFRRDLLVAAGGFDPRLDGGTPTLSGGDTDLFARLLEMGSQIAYLPEAVVWHRHPRDRRALRRVIFGYGAGLFAFLTKRLLEARDTQALVTALRWFSGPPLKALWNRLRGAPASPADLVFYEALGALAGPVLFLKARRSLPVHPASPVPGSSQTSEGNPDSQENLEGFLASRSQIAVHDHDSDSWAPAAVLDVELNRPFSAPPNLRGRCRAFVLLRLNGRPVGSLWLKLAASALRAEDLNKAMRKDPKLDPALAPANP
jgi:GT2 family glycosyltransferase